MILVENHIGSIATVTLGVIFGLLGIIYRSIIRRLEKAEGVLEIVISISGDVKHILAHCARCPENCEVRKDELPKL